MGGWVRVGGTSESLDKPQVLVVITVGEIDPKDIGTTGDEFGDGLDGITSWSDSNHYLGLYHLERNPCRGKGYWGILDDWRPGLA